MRNLWVSVIDYVRPYVLVYDLFSTKLVPIDMNIQSVFQKTFVALSIRKKYFSILPISLSDEHVAKVSLRVSPNFDHKIHETS